MARGQRSGLVEEEQLGVLTRHHDRAVSSLELQQADDPALDGEGTADALRGVVQAAAVAHERAAGWRGDQLAEWRDAILKRHALSAAGLRGTARLPARPCSRCRRRSRAGA